MKLPDLYNKRRFGTFLLGATLLVVGAVRAQEGPPPEAVREHVRAMEQHIRELRSHGQNEEAERVEAEVRELRERARGRFQRRGESPEMQEMIRHMRELQAEGRMDEAVEVRRELARRRGALQRPGRPGVPRPERPIPPEAMEERMHHLEAAIENLHAAEVHDVAERLEEELRGMRERQHELGPPRDIEPMMRRMGEEIGRLGGELEELREHINALRRHIEELHHDRDQDDRDDEEEHER